MKRHLFASNHLKLTLPLFLIAVVFAAGCGAKPKNQIAVGVGNNTSVNVARNPLPNAQLPDLTHLMLFELMKYHRSANLMWHQPAQPETIGCLNLVPSLKGARFLLINYLCSKAYTANDDDTQMVVESVKGFEQYRKTPGILSSAATLKLEVDRQTSPPKVAKSMSITRNVLLYVSNQNKVNFAANSRQVDAVLGRQARAEHWQLTIDKSTGNWSVDNNGNLTLAQGSVLNLTFQPDMALTRSFDSATVTMTAMTDVTFSAGSCPYPVGTFSWHTFGHGVTTATGYLNSSESGTTGDPGLASGQANPWPSACLENSN